MQIYEALANAPLRVFNLDPEIEQLRTSQPGQTHLAPQAAEFARQIVDEAEQRGEDWQKYEVGVALQRIDSIMRLVDFKVGNYQSVGLAMSGPDYPIDGHTHPLPLPPSASDLAIFREDSHRLVSVVVDRAFHTYFLVKPLQYGDNDDHTLSSGRRDIKAAVRDLPWYMGDWIKSAIWNIYPFAGIRFDRDRSLDHLVRVAERAGTYLFTGHYSLDTLTHYVPRRK
ncbi:hypothetical protein A3E86_01360 [Candidatus Daviesbacteria bacterium RIFCSPHIGHO2_12_FULL_47_45]|nr:MAG: hypothetical protein A3E86_01360 [Candidatus Daviesbacteria bacterium RIFCSPHIGHO2_12_FULL_47_45]